jgi:hypothetical protein
MAEIQAPTLPRPRYTFTVPEQVRSFPDDPHRFVMVPITVAEERKANDASEGMKTPLILELVKHSVVEVDGKPLSWNGTERDWIERASPKVRDLVFAAFSKVNKPEQQEVDSFLATMQVEAG